MDVCVLLVNTLVHSSENPVINTTSVVWQLRLPSHVRDARRYCDRVRPLTSDCVLVANLSDA